MNSQKKFRRYLAKTAEGEKNLAILDSHEVTRMAVNSRSKLIEKCVSVSSFSFHCAKKLTPKCLSNVSLGQGSLKRTARIRRGSLEVPNQVRALSGPGVCPRSKTMSWSKPSRGTRA